MSIIDWTEDADIPEELLSDKPPDDILRSDLAICPPSPFVALSVVGPGDPMGELMAREEDDEERVRSLGPSEVSRESEGGEDAVHKEEEEEEEEEDRLRGSLSVLEEGESEGGGFSAPSFLRKE